MNAAYLTHATTDELYAAIGPRWAVCPNTAGNRDRYGVCLSQQKYKAAVRLILHTLDTPDPRLGRARALHQEATALIESIIEEHHA